MNGFAQQLEGPDGWKAKIGKACPTTYTPPPPVVQPIEIPDGQGPGSDGGDGATHKDWGDQAAQAAKAVGVLFLVGVGAYGLFQVVSIAGAVAKAKSAADEAATALEASLATAKSGVAEINSKALEAVRAAADAQFDFVKSILGVKTVADYVTLHSEFTRKQFETLTGTTKEISALAQKVATDSVEPIKAQVAKTFKVAV